MMMMPFNCSYRNKNEPSAIYPSFGYSPPFIVDVLWHDYSRAVLKGPVTSQALKTMVVQRERMQGGKSGEDSHRKFNAGWKTGRPWLDFRQVATTTTDLDSAILCLSQQCSASGARWLASSTTTGANLQCGRTLAGGARGRSWSQSRITRARKHTRKRQTCR